MKIIGYINLCLLLLSIPLATGCEEQEEQGPQDYYDNDNFTVQLSTEKAPGHGQYRYTGAESGQDINVVVDIKSGAALDQLKITKTVNLEVDPSYGTAGTLVVDASGTDFQYDFSYTATIDDVDQLVGFTFEAINANGESEISDLTTVITLSPRDNLVRRRWAWKSILHVNNDNQEVIKECEKDNAYVFNADGTMALDFGSYTGKDGCDFDAFIEYVSWQLSEDNHFILEKGDGSIEDYKVKTFTVERLEMELTVDLTAFGLGIETYLYKFEAMPR